MRYFNWICCIVNVFFFFFRSNEKVFDTIYHQNWLALPLFIYLYFTVHRPEESKKSTCVIIIYTQSYYATYCYKRYYYNNNLNIKKKSN